MEDRLRALEASIAALSTSAAAAAAPAPPAPLLPALIQEFQAIKERLLGPDVPGAESAALLTPEDLPRAPRNPFPRAHSSRLGNWFDPRPAPTAQLVASQLSTNSAPYLELEAWAPVLSILFDITASFTVLTDAANSDLQRVLIPYAVSLGRTTDLAASLLDIIRLQATHVGTDLAPAHRVARDAVYLQHRADSYTSTTVSEVIRTISEKQTIALTKSVATSSSQRTRRTKTRRTTNASTPSTVDK